MSANPIPVQVPPPQRVGPSPALPPVEPGGRFRKPLLWLILAAIAGGGGYYAYRQYNSPQQPTAASAPGTPVIRTARVVSGNLIKTNRVAGVTSAREFSTVTAPIVRGPESRSSQVLLKLVPSGSYVKKGQLIAEIDAQSTQDHVDDLADTIAAAESDVRKRRAEQQIEWETLQQTVKVSRSEYEKAKLDAQAAEVKTDVERQLLQLSLEEAEAQYKQVQNDLKFKEQSHKAELRILELTRERHIRHRNRHLGDLERFTIQASMNGLAVMQPIFRGGEFGQVQAGDQVGAGQSFMKVVDPSSMQVEATINQTESSEFRIGQIADIKLDAFPEVTLKGKVLSIGALATGGWRQNYYIRNVPIRIAIEGADSRLIPDLSASALIQLGHADNVNLVPLPAVKTENGKTYAWVKTVNGFEKRAIEVGLTNDLQAAVLSGLEKGEEVRLN